MVSILDAPYSRRSIIRIFPGIAICGISGCIDGTGSCSEVRIEAGESSKSDADSQPLIVYDSLSQEEREILDAAIEDRYVECMPPSETLSRFLDRVRNVMESQGYPGSTPTIHVKTDGSFYALEILEEDKFISRK